jgi:hypothetical protein
VISNTVYLEIYLKTQEEDQYLHCHGNMYSIVDPLSSSTSFILRPRDIEFCCESTGVGTSCFLIYAMKDLIASVLVKVCCCCKTYVTTNN